jgi:hypothetical protein
LNFYRLSFLSFKNFYHLSFYHLSLWTHLIILKL